MSTVKRDKFAALASRTAASNDGASVPSSSTSGSTPTAETAPKRDKLAALASRNATATAGTSGASPQMDKLSALASRASGTPGPVPSGERGNKFAALAKGRGNKLAAMASSASAVESSLPKPPSPEEQRLGKLKELVAERRKILQNLDRAEQMTCRLLELAHETTKALQDLSSATDIAGLSKAYRTTLQELHPLLSLDTTKFIHPYQNHSHESNHSMYASRVEMRLALERTQVLSEFLELERNLSASGSSNMNENNKRLREEEEEPNLTL